MLGSALLSLPALALAALFIAPSAVASSNFTERTSTPSNWQTETCANVAGSYLGYNYNFGCLCYSDVSTYCSNNNINSYISSLLESYVRQVSLIKSSTNMSDPRTRQHQLLPSQCSTDVFERWLHLRIPYQELRWDL